MATQTPQAEAATSHRDVERVPFSKGSADVVVGAPRPAAFSLDACLKADPASNGITGTRSNAQRQAALRDLPVECPPPSRDREYSPSPGIAGREASAAAGPG